MTASISPTPASSNCSRISGLVSTRIRKPPSDTMIEARLRRLRGLSGSHCPQSLPIRGTPDDVPQPRILSFIARVTSWRRLVEKRVEIGACRSRSEEHTSELQSLMRISYAVFCLKKKNKRNHKPLHISDDKHNLLAPL